MVDVRILRVGDMQVVVLLSCTEAGIHLVGYAQLTEGVEGMVDHFDVVSATLRSIECDPPNPYNSGSNHIN